MDENNKILLKLENISKSFAKVENDQVTHALDRLICKWKVGNLSVWWGRPAVENPRS